MGAPLSSGSRRLNSLTTLNMRIIAGTYRSRLLKSAKGLTLRPTSDYLRETLFNVLGAGISDSRFLDLFAGTGAVGIEALSRGASHVTFIENHAATAALLRQNLESLKIMSGVSVISADALRGLQTLQAKRKPGGPGYDYVFLDPPYAAASEYTRVLQHLASSDILSPGAIVIVECRKTLDLPESYGALQRVRALRHGDSALSFYREAISTSPSAPETENPAPENP
jgi:16S rRNA (guanine966-N2)-methyltransferase